MVKRAAGPVGGVVALLAQGRKARLSVVRVCSVVEISLVAGHARRGVGQVICPARAECRVVALGALERSVGSVERETGGRVIKRRARPGGGVVAQRAILRETRLHVIRSRGAVEVCLMARVASRAARQIVSTGRTECRVVALRALQRHVSAGQREAGGRVIKRGTGPAGRVVALGAGLREARLHVIRVARIIEVRLVAGDASRAGQAVGAGRAEGCVVALNALQRDVRASQGETGGGMVEAGAVPRGGGMALLAGCREPALHVARIGRAVEILHVARGAIGRRSDELPIDMALGARHADVRTGQRELRKGAVIEGRRIPRGSAVAGLARGREAGLGVWRIVGLIKVRHVASVAGRGRVVKLPARMTGRAIQRRVRASQGEAGELQVIELRAHPVVHGMALLAGDGQT